jgi:hypothetical protein
MHMVTHGSGNANASGRALNLKPCHDIHCLSVQVSSVGNGVANVDPYAKADASIGRLVGIVDRNLLLHFHGTAHGPIDAVKDDEQRISSGLDDPATMLADRGIDHFPP